MKYNHLIANRSKMQEKKVKNTYIQKRKPVIKDIPKIIPKSLSPPALS